jgi:hypothetical protein
MADPRCTFPGCDRPCPYTDWTTCEEHNASPADLTEVAKLAEYVRRVRAGEPRFMAYAEVFGDLVFEDKSTPLRWFHVDVEKKS